MYIVKHRQRWVAVTFWCSFSVLVMSWLVMRRHGFSTTFIRCTYLIMSGDYKQMLVAGSTPANVYLPPHLRLDQRSYLDHPETELAVPPTLDIAVTETNQLLGLEGAIPSSERTDIHGKIGPFRTHSIIMTPTSQDRYVRRRLGPTAEHQELLAKEAAEAERKKMAASLS